MTGLIVVALVAFDVETFVYTSNGRLSYSSHPVTGVLGNVREPALSPDGKKALYWRSGEISPVIEVDLATGKQRQVAGTNARSPLYSPDGRTIYYTQSLPWELYAIPTAGGKPVRIFGKVQGADDLFQPSWSFGNQAMLVHDMKNVYWLDGKGKLLRKVPVGTIVGDPSFVTSASRFTDRPRHSSQIAYSIDRPLEKGQPKDWETTTALFLYDMSTKTRRRITPVGMFADEQRWSRDGNALLFTGAKGREPRSVYSIRPDGTGLHRLGRGSEPGT